MNVTAIGSKQGVSRLASSLGRTWKRGLHFRRLAILASAAIVSGAFAAAPWAAAQSMAQFSYAESVVTSAASQPSGVAVDGSGNVYVADSATGWVLKQVPSNGTYASAVLASGLNGPSGVAVGADGSVYIADTGNNRVLKETPSSESVVVGGLYHPQSVAVDGNGNVYIADTGDNVILEEKPSGSSYAQIGFWLIVGGQPDGIALDGSGNIYVAVSALGMIAKLVPNGPSSYNQYTLVSGLNQPRNLALDANGNIYVTDSANGKLLKETPSGGTYTQSVVAGGLNQPQGVAAGPNGNVYVSNSSDRQVLLLQTSGVDFGAEPVGSLDSAGPTLTFTLNSSTTLGAVQALTMGATGLAFNVAASTCPIATTPSAGSTCAVTIGFTPQSSGAIHGAVELTDIVGNVLATAYVYGAGTGPQIAFGPPSETMIGSGMNFANGVAVDGSGNLYIASSGAGQVLKETLSGGAYTQSVAVTGLTEPQHVAVDGAGNLYVTDIANQLVVEETPNGNSYAQTVVTNQLSSPDGVAVDGSGNIYITDSTAGRLIEETPTGGSYTSTLVATGLGSPVDVAVDGNGNLYIADSAGGRVLKEAPGNGTYTQTVVATGLSSPDGVAVDANGNVYISEATGVLKEAPNGGSYTQTVAANILGAPAGIALDGSGNLYISSPNLPGIQKEDVVDAPILHFRPSAVGVQSGDSPQTVTVENIGNQPLTFPIPVAGTNPGISQNFAYDPGSTCTQTDTSSAAAFTLAPGTSCSLGIDFIPASAGSFSGQAQWIDDNLNIPGPAYAAQSITLSGIGGQVVLSPTAGPLPAATAGTAYSQTLAATGGTGPYTFMATGVPAGLTLSAAGVLSGTPTAAGSSSIAVAVSDANGLTATATYTLIVDQAVPIAPPDFSLTSGSAQGLVVGPGGTVKLSFSVSPIGGSYPSSVTFTVAGLPAGATATFSPSTIAANGGPQNVSLAIQTPAAGTAMNHKPGGPFGGAALTFCFLLFPALGVRRVRRHLLRHSAMLLLLLVVAGAAGVGALSGCGSSSSSENQPVRNYTVTVTAASGSAVHSFNVGLSVQ